MSGDRVAPLLSLGHDLLRFLLMLDGIGLYEVGSVRLSCIQHTIEGVAEAGDEDDALSFVSDCLEAVTAGQRCCDCRRGHRNPLSDDWILREVDDGMDALTGCRTPEDRIPCLAADRESAIVTLNWRIDAAVFKANILQSVQLRDLFDANFEKFFKEFDL